MLFYPNNVPVTEIGFATSASLTDAALLIRNFATASITASLALNITGSTGTAGTNGGPISGPTGAQGARGVTGYRGDSVYLLSSSWHSGSVNPGPSTCGSVPTNCYSHQFHWSYVQAGTRYCDFSDAGTTYYSTDASLVAGSSLMFLDSICTNPVVSQTLGSYPAQPIAKVYSTNGIGQLQYVVDCGVIL